jgi:hypothetical protein
MATGRGTAPDPITDLRLTTPLNAANRPSRDMPSYIWDVDGIIVGLRHALHRWLSGLAMPKPDARCRRRQEQRGDLWIKPGPLQWKPY